MPFRYVVLGAGRQGTAAAYDLALFGDASEVVLADADAQRAKESAARVARLARDRKVEIRPASVDAQKTSALAALLKGRDGVLGALPHRLHSGVAKTAVQARVAYCDLGCRLETTRAVLKLDPAARKAKVPVIPDCGLAPGLASCLAVGGMEALNIHRSVSIYVGGLPQRPRPPLGYKLVHDLDDLIALYLEPAVVLRKGRLAKVAPLSELERVEIEPLGELEAALTAGAATCPWSFEGRLQDFEHKTLRYPGHFGAMAALRDLGFLDERPVEVDGAKIAPRGLFAKLAAPRLELPQDKDLVVLRVIARGEKGGRPTEVAYDMLEYHDPATGFGAMERTAGCAAGAALAMAVAGKAKPGAAPVETALPARLFLAEIRRRGLKIQERFSVTGG